MNVIIACEYSGTVRDAFIRRGHRAWSCDILPTARPGPHFQCDVLTLLRLLPGFFDLLIAHPPCTHLAVSGARHFPAKRADGRMDAAMDFFMALAEADVAKIAVENPVCVMSSEWRKPDQIIQPHEFGHPEFKATCLWLKNLAPLQATCRLPVPLKSAPEWNAWNKIHRMAPSENRAYLRSKTYDGIAEAMAQQWG